MEAFTSPNFAPLGTMGVNFDINWDIIQRHVYEGKMNAFTRLSSNISLISISPCLSLKVVESILLNSDGNYLFVYTVIAVIIEAYGMGNIPSKN